MVVGRPRFRETVGDSDGAKRWAGLSESEKERHRIAVTVRHNGYQEQSLDTATRAGLPWTEDDDLEVLFGEGRDVDIAIRIHRTWNEVHRRRAVLVKWLQDDGTIAYPESTTTRPIKVAPALCPCGASDGDHESWCPEKE
jgi:hypothetical protein